MDFNKIPQILSLFMSSLSSQGLKTEDFYFVLFVCLFDFFVLTFWWFICFYFYNGSRI